MFPAGENDLDKNEEYSAKLYCAITGDLFKGLSKFKGDTFLSDLQISFQERLFNAHQSIVCSQSKILGNMVQIQDGNIKSANIRLDELLGAYSAENVHNVLSFLYTGRIVMDDGNVLNYFMIARTLEVSTLKAFCEEHIGTSISPRSCLEILEKSKQFEAKDLEKRCIQYFKQRASEIIAIFSNKSHESPELTSILEKISEGTMIELLSKNFKVREIEVFKFVIQWGLAKQRTSQKALRDIIRNVVLFVRLISLSRTQLEEYVTPLDLVPKKKLVEVCFRKLNFVYSHPEGEEKNSEDLRAREADGNPLKFYLRPRKGNWLILEDFEHEGQYAEYCKSILQPGMLIRAVNTYESIQAGDIGEFVQHNAGYPPCQIQWRGYGGSYWLYWRDIEIIH
jgi:hypothetical protein